MKDYTRDTTIIVSNTVTNIGVKSRLYILMNWAAFPGFAKKINNSNNNSYNNNKIKLLSQRWNQSQFYI